MQNQVISDLYPDDKKNILATVTIFPVQRITFMKNFIPNRQPPKLPLLNVLAKFLTG